MKILLHTCCGNCALSPVRELQAEGHDLTGLWFNPNIHPFEEYTLRLDSLKKVADQWRIEMLYSDEYRPEDFFEKFSDDGRVVDLKGADGQFSFKNVPAHVPPAPDRCRSCYLLRLEETASVAKKEGFDAFTTTLLISPYQDVAELSLTGERLAETYNVSFYLRDYRVHFKEAMSLAKKLGLYRQKYCGCIYSRQDRDKAVRARKRA